MLCGIVERVNDLLGIVLFVQCADGTCNYTLTAVYATGGCKILFKRAADSSVIASVLCADGADALNSVAGAYAAAAENTFIGVADDGRAGVFDLKLILADRGEIVLFNAEVMRVFLKFAGLGADAGKTLFLVCGKHKLNVHLSCGLYLFGIGEDLRTVALDGIYAGGYKSARAHYLNKAQAAGADLVDILEVAQRGNIDAGGLARLQHRGAVGNGIVRAVYLYVKHFSFHLCNSSFLISWR